MICPKYTSDGAKCTLPAGHPNRCVHDDISPPVMTKAGLEAQQLVDAYQRPKLVIQRDPNCTKCHGRAYNELPEPDSFGRTIEHSVCLKCGGYLYSKPVEIISYATKRAKLSSLPSHPSKPKTHSRKNETEILTQARLAEQTRRESLRPKRQLTPRNYMAEAEQQAARAVDAMQHWNGF